MRRRAASGLLLVMAGGMWAAVEAPFFSAGGPDAAAYGEAEHYPVGSPDTINEQKYLVGSFSHFDSIFPARAVKAAPVAWQFRRAAEAPAIRYFHARQSYEIRDYLAHLPVTGLLIAKDDEILFEAYQYGRTDRDRLTSQSMAKTVTAMLVGEALAEGKIGSVTDAVGQYVAEVNDSAYGKVSLRDLLHMSSGVSCSGALPEGGAPDWKAFVRDCKTVAPAGTQFKYSAIDSQLLGVSVSRAVKMPLAQYLEEKIWRKIGTEATATWTINGSDQEVAACCLNAVLRDYARLGRLLAFDGAWNGVAVIPRQWVMDATTVHDGDEWLTPGRPARFFGYGYQTWIFPGARRMFGLLGANGQRIFVDPQAKLVMVQTAVMTEDVDPARDAEMIALWLSLVRQFGAT